MAEIYEERNVVEAGHYYEAMGLSALSLTGWQIGKKITEADQNSKLVLFIDDYHTEQKYMEEDDSFLPAEESTVMAEAMQSEAASVFSEKALAQLVPAKMQELVNHGLAKYQKKKGSFWVGDVLLGKLENPDESIDTVQPSCAFLDYMLLQEKVKLGGKQTVVLPEIYREEQIKLGTIMSKIATKGLVVYRAVFYDGNSNTKEEVIYG